MAEDTPVQCSLVSGPIKLFAATVQCISRIGKEVTVEFSDAGATFHVLDDAQSASAVFQCDKDTFFEWFRMAEGVGRCCCRLPVKALQGFLRNVSKIVELRIALRRVDSTLHFMCRLQGEAGTVKTHSFTVHESRWLTAPFDRLSAPNRLSLPPDLLQSRLKHFRGADEVSVEIVADGIRLETPWSSMGGGAQQEGRNLMERASLRTAVHVHQDELLECVRLGEHLVEFSDEGDAAGRDPGADRPVKVCVGTREVQAVLALAIAAKISPVSIYFSEGGSPLLLSTTGLREGQAPEAAAGASEHGLAAGAQPPLTVDLVVATVQEQLVSDAPSTAAEPAGEGDTK